MAYMEYKDLLVVHLLFSVNDMMLYVQLRLDAERSYTPPSELHWDLSQGASLQSLTNCVSRSLGLDEDSVRLAKHQPEQFEWQLLSLEGRDKQQVGSAYSDFKLVMKRYTDFLYTD